jgi:acyl-coenzyme A synthetase/AMP-(fatty) acid ligase
MLQGAPPSPEDHNHSVHTAFGNGLRPDVWEAFRTRFGVRNICEFYGASEAVATLLNYNSGTFSPPKFHPHKTNYSLIIFQDLTA